MADFLTSFYNRFARGAPRDREVTIEIKAKEIGVGEFVFGAETTQRIGVARGRFTAPDDIDALNPVIESLFSAETDGESVGVG